MRDPAFHIRLRPLRHGEARRARPASLILHKAHGALALEIAPADKILTDDALADATAAAPEIAKSLLDAGWAPDDVARIEITLAKEQNIIHDVRDRARACTDNKEQEHESPPKTENEKNSR